MKEMEQRNRISYLNTNGIEDIQSQDFSLKTS